MLERTPEPELMDDVKQARQYAEADFAASDQAFVAAILASLSEAQMVPRRILDLGCGPGNISFPLAAALPGTPLLAIDGALAMVRLARERQRSQPETAGALHVHQARLPLTASAFEGLPAALQPPFDLLVSNSLLHHLQDPAALWSSLRLLGAPAALVLIRDLRRPHDRAEQESLVQRYAGQAPDLLRRDFRHSLAAAYRPAEVEAQLSQAGLEGLRVEARDDRYLDVSGLLP